MRPWRCWAESDVASKAARMEANNGRHIIVDAKQMECRGKREMGMAKKREPRLLRGGVQIGDDILSQGYCLSTICAGELNFSVRNGKRWDLTAITT